MCIAEGTIRCLEIDVWTNICASMESELASCVEPFSERAEIYAVLSLMSVHPS